jgi:hypothetical protein
MKNIVIFLCISLCNVQLISGQTSEKIVVGSGETIKEALIKQIYRYPTFQTGKVYLKNGTSSNARLNLNFWLDEMQFINAKNDTLTIADPTAIKFIEIGNDYFFYNEGFLEVVQVYGQIKLAKKRKIKFADQEKVGAYGQRTTTSDISSSASHTASNGLLYDLKVDQDLVISKDEVFYLVDEKGNVRLANKGNVLKAYSVHKNQVNEYLKKNKVDFKNEEQLKALLHYSNTI